MIELGQEPEIIKQRLTDNIKAPNNIELLKQHFSHCFDKAGAFDFAKFKQELSQNEETNFSKESYGLEWLGKSYARLLASDEATTLLRENKEWNAQAQNQNSQNLLLKGDNLEVLKHLSNAYYQKIKMIYIDPPYNTGSDGFVYQDNRKFNTQELAELAGIDEEQAQRILDFTQSKSNSHSAWLTFMYTRLYIAKQLLKDDGVLFISIDDNEQANLKLLCDEIFGEDNFVGNIIWHKKTQPSFLSSEISNVKEYILLYKKSEKLIKTFGGTTNPDKKIEMINASNKEDVRTFNRNNIIFDNGAFNGILQKGKYGNANLQIELLQNVEIANGKPLCDFALIGRFKWSQVKINESFSKGDTFYLTTKTLRPIMEQKEKVVKTKPILDLLSKKTNFEIGTNTDGTNEIANIFQKKELFTNPKPTKLIKYLIKSIENNPNDLILDFFAGSGTTGEAVMQLNSEDGGNRKFILVQWDEAIKENSEAYRFCTQNNLKPVISSITQERLIRAGQKLTKGNITDLSTLDLGFKIFETIANDEGVWANYDFAAKESNDNIVLLDEEKLQEQDLQNLLTTWKTYDNIPLTQDLSAVDLAGYKGYYFDSKLYLVYPGFATEHLVALLNKIDGDTKFNPANIYLFGFNFESKMLRELAENIANYKNKKAIEMDLITRY